MYVGNFIQLWQNISLISLLLFSSNRDQYIFSWNQHYRCGLATRKNSLNWSMQHVIWPQLANSVGVMDHAILIASLDKKLPNNQFYLHKSHSLKALHHIYVNFLWISCQILRSNDVDVFGKNNVNMTLDLTSDMTKILLHFHHHFGHQTCIKSAKILLHMLELIAHMHISAKFTKIQWCHIIFSSQ